MLACCYCCILDVAVVQKYEYSFRAASVVCTCVFTYEWEFNEGRDWHVSGNVLKIKL